MNPPRTKAGAGSAGDVPDDPLPIDGIEVDADELLPVLVRHLSQSPSTQERPCGLASHPALNLVVSQKPLPDPARVLTHVPSRRKTLRTDDRDDDGQ
jgi:hypothetical protein